MAVVNIKDVAADKTRNENIDDAVFGIEPNVFVVHQVVRSQQAALRAGTHETKTRARVSGGGKKPWRQKGTGRARQGTIRAPQWAGGGVVFGPHPRSYAFKVPNKVVKLAMRSALSSKLFDEVLFVVENFKFDKPSAKDASAILKNLGLEDRKITILVENENDNAYLSFRNLDRVRVLFAYEANTYDLVDNTAVLFSADSLSWVGEVLK
ncbi:MAG: 50S ribosomal protein L4 [Coriobacteriia bacterium]|nr:50S ribosomal protein L4 [Coriobacteriia bacterium]